MEKPLNIKIYIILSMCIALLPFFLAIPYWYSHNAEKIFFNFSTLILPYLGLSIQAIKKIDDKPKNKYVIYMHLGFSLILLIVNAYILISQYYIINKELGIKGLMVFAYLAFALIYNYAPIVSQTMPIHPLHSTGEVSSNIIRKFSKYLVVANIVMAVASLFVPITYFLTELVFFMVFCLLPVLYIQHKYGKGLFTIE